MKKLLFLIPCAYAQQCTLQCTDVCTLLFSVTDTLKDSYGNVKCEMKDGQMYDINWNKKNLKSILDNKSIISGESEMDISNATIANGTIYTSSRTLDIQKKSHRKLSLESKWNKTVLVVRVISPDASPSMTNEKLSDSIFGTHGDKNNLKMQYDKCSHGKMNFTPFKDEAIDILNGVIDIRIALNVKNSHSQDVQNAVTEIISGYSWFQSVDYIMYCLPPGTSGGWIAYAYGNHWLSVYNDKWCMSLSAQMHEIGHNLGLGHSNENGKTYEDVSGYMGFSFVSEDTPLKCFNAYNSWKLGWFRDKSKTVKAGENYHGLLSSTVDYNLSAALVVLVRFNTATNTDYYINYNKKTGHNIDTGEGQNQVLVVTADGDGTDYTSTNLVAKLSQGQSFIMNNITSEGGKMILWVDSVGQDAKLRIEHTVCNSDIECVYRICSDGKCKPHTQTPPTNKGKYKTKPSRCRGCI